MIPPPLEAALTAAAGGVLAGVVGLPFGLAVPLGAIGVCNGAVSGWRGIYGWRSPAGWIAFTLDSTWALATTGAALVSHALGAVRGRPGYVAELSHRRHRHVYQRGLQPRRGFAITLGNVVSGVGDVRTPARRRLVTDHEDVHVWQCRWFGPFFPLLYAGWMVGGAVAGSGVWLVRRRDERFGRVVETCAYYCNPFEWWAYSRDGQWRPKRMVPGLGWRRPLAARLARSPGGDERAGPLRH